MLSVGIDQREPRDGQRRLRVRPGFADSAGAAVIAHLHRGPGDPGHRACGSKAGVVLVSGVCVPRARFGRSQRRSP